MTHRLSKTIGYAAAAFVVATYRRRVLGPAVFTLTAMQDVLKEVWTSETLEAQLNANRSIFLDFLENPPAYQAPLLIPNGWGERYGRRQRARRAKRRRRIREAALSILPAPPFDGRASGTW